MYILVLNFFLWFLICMTNVAVALKMYHVNINTSYHITVLGVSRASDLWRFGPPWSSGLPNRLYMDGKGRAFLCRWDAWTPVCFCGAPPAPGYVIVPGEGDPEILSSAASNERNVASGRRPLGNTPSPQALLTHPAASEGIAGHPPRCTSQVPTGCHGVYKCVHVECGR